MDVCVLAVIFFLSVSSLRAGYRFDLSYTVPSTADTQEMFVKRMSLSVEWLPGLGTRLMIN